MMVLVIFEGLDDIKPLKFHMEGVGGKICLEAELKDVCACTSLAFSLF